MWNVVCVWMVGGSDLGTGVGGGGGGCIFSSLSQLSFFDNMPNAERRMFGIYDYDLNMTFVGIFMTLFHKLGVIIFIIKINFCFLWSVRMYADKSYTMFSGLY